MSARPCRGPHHGEDPPITSRPLCEQCAAKVARAIADLPELYVHLYLALEPGTGARSTIHGTPAPPMPLNPEPETLMRRICDTVLAWDEVIVDVHRLAERPAREGVAITTACRHLAQHLDTLLAQPATAVRRWVDDAWALDEVDGPQAALDLLDLRNAARRLLGQTRGRDVLGIPCPDVDCGAAASLTRRHGSDTVECEACGRRWTRDDFTRLTQLLSVMLAEQGRMAP